MEEWEYTSTKVETEGLLGGILDVRHFDNVLNKLGEQSWELVSCLTINVSSGASREVIAVFKRRKPS